MWNEYYDEESSEVEQVLDEFKEKLVDILLTDARADVDAIEARNKSLTAHNDRLKSENYELQNKNKTLANRISELEEEVRKKYFDISTTKFQLGEYVYVADEGERQLYKCPACDGTGTIYMTQDNIKYSANCPKCSYGVANRHERSVSVTLYRQVKKKIVEIYIEVTSDKVNTRYKVENDSCWKPEDRLFKSSFECQYYITEHNQLEIEKAKKGVGITDAD